MLKSKVSCWFCNKESSVFILNKNSWNCENCNQYNGFKKDGDYNRMIPEMQKENKKSFCINSINKQTSESTKSTNLLCDRCNNMQEQKLNELNKFEARVEEHYDEELKIFKSKLDHIYDLCRPCKLKLNQHLQRQDLQIGYYLSNDKIQKSNSTLKTALQSKNILKQQSGISIFILNEYIVKFTNSRLYFKSKVMIP
jgi:hypothetical protein